MLVFSRMLQLRACHAEQSQIYGDAHAIAEQAEMHLLVSKPPQLAGKWPVKLRSVCVQGAVIFGYCVRNARNDRCRCELNRAMR